MLMVACCGLGIVGSRAQQAVFVPVCSGTNDTAAFQTIISGATTNPLTIKIPFKSDLETRCKLTTITFPENITLDNTEGSGIVRDSPTFFRVATATSWALATPSLRFPMPKQHSAPG